MNQPTDPSVAIWRYMDFTKFVSVLETNSLFFARADCLGDAFEGSYPKLNHQVRPIVRRHTYKGAPEEMLHDIEQFDRKHFAWQRQWTFINCWHMNPSESAAMWRLYAKSNESVAIRSTYRQLAEQLDNKTCLGVVKYIDFEHALVPEGNMLTPYVHKRLSFAHENEARAIFLDLPTKNHESDFDAAPPDGGIFKSVALSSLITDVFVAPTSPRWFLALVEQVCQRYKLAKPVRQSSLDDRPLY